MPTAKKTIKYAAFLRGINVGGSHPVKMSDVKKIMEDMGMSEVKTLLASGNVVFTSTELAAKKLETKLATAFEKAFGHKVYVIVRTVGDIAAVVKANPFKAVKVTPETRLYVTLFPDKPKASLKLPYKSDSKELVIMKFIGADLYSVLVLINGSRSVDAMAIIEKSYGKDCTTRNWNTLVKVAHA